MEEELQKIEGTGTEIPLEEEKTAGAGATGQDCPAPQKKGVKGYFKEHFTGKRIAAMAVFTALAYALSWLEIPTPMFGMPVLKLDFGNVFILLISFLLGPLEGVLVCLCKEGLRCMTSFQTLCVGELANFLLTSICLLLPSILYQRRRKFTSALIGLSASCVIVPCMAILVNRFIVFPTYAFLFGGSIFGLTVEGAFAAWWPAVLIFNLIKTVSVAILTLVLYKRLSTIFKKWKI